MRLTLTRPRPDLRPRHPVHHPTAGGPGSGPNPEGLRPAQLHPVIPRPAPFGRVVAHPASSEQLAQAGQEDVEGRGVHPAVGDDHVGVALEGSMNCSWLGRTVARYCSITLAVRPLALGDVALEPADEAHVGVGVDEDPQVEPLAQLGLVEHEDALDHHDPGRRDLDPSGRAAGRWRSRRRAPAPGDPPPARPTWSSSSGQSKASGWS